MAYTEDQQRAIDVGRAMIERMDQSLAFSDRQIEVALRCFEDVGFSSILDAEVVSMVRREAKRVFGSNSTWVDNDLMRLSNKAKPFLTTRIEKDK